MNVYEKQMNLIENSQDYVIDALELSHVYDEFGIQGKRRDGK